MKKPLLFLLLALLTFESPAQQLFKNPLQKRGTHQSLRKKTWNGNPTKSPDAPQNPIRKTCYTMEADSALRARYPQMGSLKEFEESLQKNITQYQEQLHSGRIAQEVITIPIIVHVVHNGEPIGTGPNISAAQVQSQIDVLNEDFRRLGNGFNDHPDGADIEIEFALAIWDEEGNRLDEPGIDRVDGGKESWDIANIQTQLKPQTIWDPKQYLNIWTVTFGGDVDNLLGFAQFPNLSGLSGLDQVEGLSSTDGVVVSHFAFGTVGILSTTADLGRTASHEIGHWLGLRHLWGDGDCSVDDFCSDTPNANGAFYAQVSTGCDGITHCGGDRMIENYMDYSNDGCMNLFTQCQKMRMRTVMDASPRRKELKTSDVHLETDVPFAFFTIDTDVGCEGTVVNFTDQSTNNPTAWQWSFFDNAGNVLATFDGQNQQLSFNAAGTYTVELVATNDNGSDTLRIPSLISIFSSNSTDTLVEDFETEATQLDNWVVLNPDDDREFQISELSAFGQGDHSILFDNYGTEDDPSGTVDVLITPPLDFSSGENLYLTFDHAYARFGGDFSDTLALLYTPDCGDTFGFIWARGGDQLATAPATQDPFVPTNDQWSNNQVSLEFLKGQPQVHLLFANISGWGNNLYLDNITVKGYNVTTGPDIQVTVSSTQVCAEGEIQFKDNSGNWPIAWQWEFEGGTPATSQTQHPLVTYDTPGIYDVTLTATNEIGPTTAFFSQVITITALPQISLIADQDSICPGGQVSITADGAAEYFWFDQRSIDPVYLGETYQVQLFDDQTYAVIAVDNAGCLDTADIIITTLPVPEVSIQASAEEICEGGAVLLTAAGATAFTWSDEADNPLGDSDTLQVVMDQTSSFFLVGTDAGGCEGAAFKEIQVLPLPDVRIQTEQEVFCRGSQFTLDGSGASSYQWFDQEGDVLSGDAELTLSADTALLITLQGQDSSGCMNQDSIDISVNIPPTATIAVNGDTLTASEANAYQWLVDEVALPAGQGGNDRTLVPEESGSYQVEVTDASGCTDTSEVVTLEITGLDILDISNSIKLYPNPTDGKVLVEITTSEVGTFDLRVIDISGKTMRTQSLSKDAEVLQFELDLRQLPDGLYFVVVSSDGMAGIQKIWKN